MICSMTRNVWFLKQLLLFAGAISVVGCGWYGDKPADRVASQPVQQQKSKPVSVVIVDHSEIMKRIASHRGKIVVLDCWSTSCPPCVREFPGLVTLQKEYGDSVVCLSLSFDYEGFGVPEDVLPPVQKFLEKVSAGSIENLLNRDGADSFQNQENREQHHIESVHEEFPESLMTPADSFYLPELPLCIIPSLLTESPDL